MTDNPDRRAVGRAEVVEVDDPAVPTEVVIVERVGSDGNIFHQLPFALTPGPPVSTTALRDSIESTAAAVAAGLPQAAAAPRWPISCCAAHPEPAAALRCPAAPIPSPTSPLRCSTSTRRTWRCMARPGPARPIPPLR